MRGPTEFRCPASMSAEASDDSVVSCPLAVPALAPAPGTRLMGAFSRFAYPDLMRLFETDSLLRVIRKVRVDKIDDAIEYQRAQVQHLPDFGN